MLQMDRQTGETRNTTAAIKRKKGDEKNIT